MKVQLLTQELHQKTAEFHPAEAPTPKAP
jgi:hypothetical protein